MFFGHLHSLPEHKFGFGKSVDVGYDAQKQWLITIDEAIDQVKDRDKHANPTWIDHHD